MVDKNEGTGAGAAGGFQLPLGISRRKGRVAEMLGANPDITVEAACAFFGGLDEAAAEEHGGHLDSGDHGRVADAIRRHFVREMVRSRVREVVRKKPGGGGYVLYAPNPKKKGPAKAVGNFPTKLDAKRAELARFPPKDQGRLARQRTQIARLMKDPKKRAEKEREAAKEKGGRKRPAARTEGRILEAKCPACGDPKAYVGMNDVECPSPKCRHAKASKAPGRRYRFDVTFSPDGHKKFCDEIRMKFKADVEVDEKPTPNGDHDVRVTVPDAQAPAFEKFMQDEGGYDIDDIKAESRFLRGTIRALVAEALFREESEDSHWDEYVGRLPPGVIAHDKKVQRFQRAIEDRSGKVLEMALASIKKALGKGAQVKSFGVKRDADRGKTYLGFSVTLGEVAVEPIYIYVEHGVPRIEVSDNAKAALTKADPDDAKAFRAELVTVQERVLDRDDSVAQAIASRDKHLERMQDEIDKYLSGLSPLQVSLAKQLMVKKYRKLG